MPTSVVLGAIGLASGMGTGLACNEGDLLVGRNRDSGFDATALGDAPSGSDAEAGALVDALEEKGADAALDASTEAGSRACDLGTTGPCPRGQYCQFDDAGPCMPGHGWCVDRPESGACVAGARLGESADGAAGADADAGAGGGGDGGGVCGCNQVVYASACEARAAGADILGPGNLCPTPSPPPCNSELSADCPPGDFCDFVDIGCGAGIQGRCIPRDPTPPCENDQLPDGALHCTPICGCDMHVYCTACFANRDGGVDRTVSGTGTCP